MAKQQKENLAELRPLTSEMFGKLLVLAWAEQHGRSILPSRESLTFALLADPAPERVQSILHVDDRTGEPRIQEFTEYVIAAQQDGLLRRMNPSHVVGEVRVDAPVARRLLGQFAKYYEREISWLRARVSAAAAQPG